MKNTVDFKIITPNEKLTLGLVPYLTFPLTKSCNFNCIYCGIGGETTASLVHSHCYDTIIERTKIAIKHNIRKFRFTGGEPFTYPKLFDLISFFNDLDVFLLVNTNASLIIDKSQIAEISGPNVHYAASLDSLDEDNFNRISGTTQYFERVIQGIKFLSKKNRLLRLNMVVSKYNYKELFSIIEFCQDLGCHLKLLDVVSVPLPYSTRDKMHVSLDEVEKKLAEKAEKIELHEYARGFGTPCKIYSIKGVNVTVKSTSHGSRYDEDGICSQCPYFPCHEGLYDLFHLPDDRLCGCRWSKSSVSTSQQFEEALEEMIKIFQRATWVKQTLTKGMVPAPKFVMDTGLYNNDWEKNKR